MIKENGFIADLANTFGIFKMSYLTIITDFTPKILCSFWRVQRRSSGGTFTLDHLLAIRFCFLRHITFMHVPSACSRTSMPNVVDKEGSA